MYNKVMFNKETVMFEGDIKNPKMHEYQITTRTAAIRVSPLGGFLTRLNLGGYDLLYLDHDEYLNKANLESSKHYGAPFLSPPGVNSGYPRHGYARNTVWEVVGNSGRSLSLFANVQGLDYLQTYKLHADELRIDIVVENNTTIPMPCETGYHYYFDVSPENVLLSETLDGLNAWDNIELKYTKVDLQQVYDKLQQGTIDLHITNTDRNILKFYDKEKAVLVVLKMHSPIIENNTFVLFADQNFPGRTAIETWSAPQGTVNHNSSRGTMINPGESVKFSYSVAIEK